MMVRPLNHIAAGFRQALRSLRSYPEFVTPIPAIVPLVLPHPPFCVVPRVVAPAPPRVGPAIPLDRDLLVYIVRDPEFAGGGIDDARDDTFDGIDDAYDDDGCQESDFPDAGYDDPMAYVVPVMARPVRFIGSRIRPSRFMLAG